MIIPNLMVTDIARSIAFYRDVLGMKVSMTVMPNREVHTGPDSDGAGAAFATLEWQGSQLMLQTVASLAADVPSFSAEQQPTPGGTVYVRGLHPDAIIDRVPKEHILKPAEVSWYGMKELYLRDPDGHIVCVGAPEGPPPQST